MAFVVLGNITVDEAMHTPIWPSPGQTVVVGAPVRDLGGKGANQALNLKRAGGDVRFVAAVGDDDLARWVGEILAADGLSPENLIRLPKPSDRSLIFVHPNGENAIASVTECSAAVSEAQARAAVANARAGDVLVLQGNLSFEATRAACREARERELSTCFNPSPLREGFASLLPLVDLLVVNEGEAIRLSGVVSDSPEATILRLHQAGAGDVVLTRGARGSVAFGRRGAASVKATPVATPVDSTGAGDTYMGVLAAALYARDLPLSLAMKAASAAATLTVARRGTWSAFPTKDEIDAIFVGL
jgi:ribokinase